MQELVSYEVFSTCVNIKANCYPSYDSMPLSSHTIVRVCVSLMLHLRLLQTRLPLYIVKLTQMMTIRTPLSWKMSIRTSKLEHMKAISTVFELKMKIKMTQVTRV